MSRKGVTPTFKELREDMKKMTFREKVDHLWTYYKEYLLIVFLVVLVVSFTVSMLVNTNKKTLLSGMMVNITISQRGYNYLSQDYHTYLDADPKWEVVQLDYTNFSSLADPTSSEDNYAASMLLIARVSGQMLDYALLDQFALEFYVNQDVFLDLQEFFTPEELEAMGTRVWWARPEPEDGYEVEDYEDGELDPWVVAVDLAELPFFQAHCPEEEHIYFAMSGNNPDMEGVRAFLEYVNNWQPETA